jgi:hypothetical protein
LYQNLIGVHYGKKPQAPAEDSVQPIAIFVNLRIFARLSLSERQRMRRIQKNGTVFAAMKKTAEIVIEKL